MTGIYVVKANIFLMSCYCTLSQRFIFAKLFPIFLFILAASVCFPNICYAVSPYCNVYLPPLVTNIATVFILISLQEN